MGRWSCIHCFSSRSEAIKSELRSFLAFYNVYRTYIANFTVIIQLLDERLRKGEPDKVTLDEKQLKFFKGVHRQALFASDIGSTQSTSGLFGQYLFVCLCNLRYPLPNLRGWKEKTNRIWSRTINRNECNYPA